MTTSRIALLGIVVLAGSFISSEKANAASYEHIDSLALKLQSNSAKLYHEFKLHYSHTPEFRHLISDASSMYHRCKHIHELAHHHGSLHHLASDLRTLDRSFHHLDRLVKSMECDAEHGFSGHIHGYTGHVHSLLRQMARDIHHLREDIEELTDPHHGHGGGHGIGHGNGQGGVHIIGSTRRAGEIRSNWRNGLNDLHRARSRFTRSIR